MSYLSSNQLKQYEDQGFVSPINIFSKDKAKEIRNEIELIENKIPRELEKSGRYNAHLISPLLDEVTHNSKILDAVESLIGENILVCGTTLFIKNPNIVYLTVILISLLIFLYNVSGKLFLGNSGISLISIFFIFRRVFRVPVYSNKISFFL